MGNQESNNHFDCIQFSLDSIFPPESTKSLKEDPCLKLFTNINRFTSNDELQELLTDAWSENPVKTGGILLHLRDCRGGRGEKRVVFEALIWLRQNFPRTYLLNLATFIQHGCIKDLSQLVALLYQRDQPLLGQDSFIELELMAELLKQDWKKINDVKFKDQDIPDITLAGKWAPSQNTFFDKDINGNQAKKLAEIIFDQQPDRMKLYRQMLSRLRAIIRSNQPKSTVSIPSGANITDINRVFQVYGKKIHIHPIDQSC